LTLRERIAGEKEGAGYFALQEAIKPVLQDIPGHWRENRDAIKNEP
jgi:hypothetical protein